MRTLSRPRRDICCTLRTCGYGTLWHLSPRARRAENRRSRGLTAASTRPHGCALTRLSLPLRQPPRLLAQLRGASEQQHLEHSCSRASQHAPSTYHINIKHRALINRAPRVRIERVTYACAAAARMAHRRAGAFLSAGKTCNAALAHIFMPLPLVAHRHRALPARAAYAGVRGGSCTLSVAHGWLAAALSPRRCASA